jgi:tetratricopeptide (TPR) repeat protein
VKHIHLCVLACVLATACASSKPDYSFLTNDQWAAELRKRGVDPQFVSNPLTSTSDMRETAEQLARPGGPGGPVEKLRNLQSGLFDETQFPFRYRNRGTFTAAEAFYRREGNCLSFTNLFVSLSRSIGIGTKSAFVTRRMPTEKDGDLIIVNTHVVAVYFEGLPKPYIFDFDRRPHERVEDAKPLDDLWVTALYLNNRGADELRATHPEIATRYFDYATRLAPEFVPAWGNLGVARRRLGDIPGAFEAYRRALERSADDPTILGNLASLYRFVGKESEAQAALAAANLSRATPHLLVVRGDLELTKGNVSGALKLYKRARSQSPATADPWVGMARAELARNHAERARNYLERALTLEPSDASALAFRQQLDEATQRARNTAK